jgi:hypothetical protein
MNSWGRLTNENTCPAPILSPYFEKINKGLSSLRERKIGILENFGEFFGYFLA